MPTRWSTIMAFEDIWVVEFLIHMEVLAPCFWCFSVYDSVTCERMRMGEGRRHGQREGVKERVTHIISMEILRIEGTAGFSAICYDGSLSHNSLH